MIKKKLIMPILVQKLKALLDRTPKSHINYPVVKKDYKDNLSGYDGERNLDYYIGFLPKADFNIYHDLRLPTDDYKFFQMDVPFASLNFILIVEVKNYSGSIICDTTYNQLIHEYGGVKVNYGDPLAQVIRQRHHLIRWLARHGFPAIPVEYLVVFTNENCILETDDKNHPFARRFLRAEYLIEKISRMKSQYNKQILTPKDLSKANNLWLKQHTPKNVDVLKKYGISADELIRGVPCPECGHLPMVRAYGKWVCPVCSFSSKDAHIPALFAYKLLVKNTITNRECREFLKIDDPNAAKYILKQLHLAEIGINRHRVYSLDSLPIIKM